MNVPAKLGLYGLGLAVAFAGAMGAGGLVGPLLPDTTEASGHTGHEDTRAADTTAEETPMDGAHTTPSGLQISQDGYTLTPVRTPGRAGEEETLSFRVLGPGGEPVTAFDESHDERMHLIVVGRDMSGYQHVHPEMAQDGTWSIPLELDTPGTYRMFADFVPREHGSGLTLGADLTIAGDQEPQTLPAPARTAEVDGYTVTLDGGLVPGRAGAITLTVTRDGEEVTDLEPYLGAYGHLVALRAGDLAYLHVHPEGEPGDGATEPGPEITFQATAPSTGDYRLFLDFKHGGEVRTAEFTVTADGTNGGSATTEEHTDPEGHAPHSH
ncbi:hypothetical protein [Nocardiopsis sp. CC223A]|uniref:hypothetical protein n=1 Tax=Nocardiopsis sp. CC223A TaxID=3044051 RepID=UPI00278C6CD1|nr:hypothetical protein [Nocardiopsis sp. CC223A]